jgi:type IX secretion system PorP/SprF family membrane protein
MKPIIHAAVVLMLSTLALQSTGQDFHFSQLFETPILRNPSLTGVYSGDVRFQAVTRNQWNTITNAYQTTAISGETKTQVGESEDFLSYGGQLVYDKAGTIALTTTRIMPVINYNKSLSDAKNVYLSLGFMGGYVQRSLDRSKMTTNNQFNGLAYDASLADGENLVSGQLSYFDASAGLSLNAQVGDNPSNNFYAGVALHHFNQSQKISFHTAEKVAMQPKWVGSGGIRMALTNVSTLTFEADYMVQGSYRQLIGGAMVSWKLGESDDNKYAIHAGAMFRMNDAIIPVAKLEFKPFAVAFSYDANVSVMRQSTNGRGGFECSIIYQKHRKQNSSMEAVRCMQY